MVFSQEYIQELKSRVNIVDYISRYTSLKSSGNVYIGTCPNPGHTDSTPSFRVWNNTQSWACMSCHNGSKGGSNYGSDIIAFVQWIDNINFIDAVIKLSSYAGMDLPNNKHKSEYNKLRKIAYDSHKQYKKVEDYLKGRGINEKTIKQFKIGFNGKQITIPLFDNYNRVIGFSNRSYNNPNIPKYINSKNSDIFKKNKYLYNYNNLDYSDGYIVITEGAFDTIVSYQNGVKNVVSTLGTSFTDNHAQIIKSTNMIPIIAFDGDDAGRVSAKKASEKLEKIGVYTKILLLPEGEDLASLSNRIKDSTRDYVISRSMSFNYYKANLVVSKINNQIYDIKIKHYEELKSVINSIENDVEKKIISDKIELGLGLKINN